MTKLQPNKKKPLELNFEGGLKVSVRTLQKKKLMRSFCVSLIPHLWDMRYLQRYKGWYKEKANEYLVNILNIKAKSEGMRSVYLISNISLTLRKEYGQDVVSSLNNAIEIYEELYDEMLAMLKDIHFKISRNGHNEFWKSSLSGLPQQGNTRETVHKELVKFGFKDMPSKFNTPGRTKFKDYYLITTNLGIYLPREFTSFQEAENFLNRNLFYFHTSIQGYVRN